MLERVSLQRIFCPVLAYDKKRVKEVRIVIVMVDSPRVGRDVAVAQRLQTVYVVSMPSAKMLDAWMFFFNRAECIFLILTVLKKHDWRPAGLGAGLYNSCDLDSE